MTEKLQHHFLQLYQNWQEDFEDITDVYDLQDFESNLLDFKEQSRTRIENHLEINNKEIEENLKVIKISQVQAQKKRERLESVRKSRV